MNFLATIVLKATILMALAYLLAAAMARRPASSRHLVWTGAMAALLALPVLSLVLPGWRMGQALSPAHGVQRVVVESQSAITGGLAPARAAASAPPAWLMLWAIGAAGVLGRMLAGLGRAVWIARRSEPLHLPGLDRLVRQAGVRRALRILETRRASMPLTFGVLRPVILLPETARDWTEERRRVVLQHELAHVKRLDWLTQALAQLACALYWFHPLIWMAAARQRKEREQACDDCVLTLGTGGPEYAGHLLELARSLQPAAVWPMEVAMAQPSDLESRLAALLDTRRDRRPVGRLAAALVPVFAVAAAALLAPGIAPAQNSGSTLSGIVTDATRARVPNAMVTAVNLDTKRKEVAMTDPVGAFQFAGIAAGTYTLEVKSPGFKLFERRVTVTAGAGAEADVTLDLGQIAENLEVTGKRETPVTPSGAPQRIRVGGNVQAVRLISKVDPTYPRDAQDRGVEGAVMLNAVVGKDGSLMSVTPVNTLVDPTLVQAALDAVRLWRYQPSLLNGVPVEVVTTITVNFRLTP